MALPPSWTVRDRGTGPVFRTEPGVSGLLLEKRWTAQPRWRTDSDRAVVTITFVILFVPVFGALDPFSVGFRLFWWAAGIAALAATLGAGVVELWWILEDLRRYRYERDHPKRVLRIHADADGLRLEQGHLAGQGELIFDEPILELEGAGIVGVAAGPGCLRVLTRDGAVHTAELGSHAEDLPALASELQAYFDRLRARGLRSGTRG